jgi:hypothetical protein
VSAGIEDEANSSASNVISLLRAILKGSSNCTGTEDSCPGAGNNLKRKAYSGPQETVNEGCGVHFPEWEYGSSQ